MALRERFRQIVPGLFPEGLETRVLTTAEASGQAMVRAASFSLYGGQFGTPLIVPDLDHPSPIGTSPADEMRENPVVFAPIYRVSFRMGALPIKVYRFTSTQGRQRREEAQDHPLYKLMRNPNPDITRNLLISGTVQSMFAYAKCGWWKERKFPTGPRDPSNPIVALWPIPGGVLFPMRTPNRILSAFQIRVAGYPTVNIPASDVVFHRLMPDVHDWANGTSPAAPLGNIAEFSGSAMEAATRLFHTALLQRLYVSLGSLDLEPEQINRIKAQLEVASRNPYAIPIMEGGAEIKEMGTGPDHSLLTNSLTLANDIVRHTFGFPKDEDNLTAYYAEVIQPVADAIEQEMERSLVPDFEDSRVFPEFQFRELLAGDPLTRAKLHQTRILSGQETINEAREEENRPAVPGGDIPNLPLNVIPINDVSVRARKKDTAGGLGGAEGRGTIPRIAEGSAGNAPANLKAASEDEAVATGFRAQQERWRSVRGRVLSGQAQALERRLRGAINQERDELRAVMAPVGTSVPARTKFDPSLYDAPTTDGIFSRTDANIHDLLSRFMTATAVQGAGVAASMIDRRMAQRDDEPLTANATLDDGTTALVLARVEAIVQRFSERRGQALDELLGASADRTMRQTSDAISKEWGTLATHLTDVLAETEAKWAFERGAASGWGDRGIDDLAIVRGSENCTTGMCARIVEQGRFRPSDVPTPLHPGCNCMVVPSFLVE